MMNELMAQSGLGNDGGALMDILGFLGFWINVLYIIFFVTTAIGLYKIAKKLSLAYPWLAFVPLIQIYTLLKSAGYNFWKWLLLLFLYSIWGIIVFALSISAWTMIIASMNPTVSTAIISGAMLWIIAWLLFVFIMTYFIYNWIAKRTGQGTWTAILMTLFPWCMLWIVANRMPEKQGEIQWEVTIITEEL